MSRKKQSLQRPSNQQILNRIKSELEKWLEGYQFKYPLNLQNPTPEGWLTWYQNRPWYRRWWSYWFTSASKQYEMCHYHSLLNFGNENKWNLSDSLVNKLQEVTNKLAWYSLKKRRFKNYLNQLRASLSHEKDNFLSKEYSQIQDKEQTTKDLIRITSKYNTKSSNSSQQSEPNEKPKETGVPQSKEPKKSEPTLIVTVRIRDLCATLEMNIDNKVTLSAVKRAYHEIILRKHPDKITVSSEMSPEEVQSLKDRATEKIKGVTVAYSDLLAEFEKNFKENDVNLGYQGDSTLEQLLEALRKARESGGR